MMDAAAGGEGVVKAGRRYALSGAHVSVCCWWSWFFVAIACVSTDYKLVQLDR